MAGPALDAEAWGAVTGTELWARLEARGPLIYGLCPQYEGWGCCGRSVRVPAGCDLPWHTAHTLHTHGRLADSSGGLWCDRRDRSQGAAGWSPRSLRPGRAATWLPTPLGSEEGPGGSGGPELRGLFAPRPARSRVEVLGTPEMTLPRSLRGARWSWATPASPLCPLLCPRPLTPPGTGAERLGGRSPAPPCPVLPVPLKSFRALRTSHRK